MNITEQFKNFTLLGAEWVLWLLIILSIVSIGVMVERFLFFRARRLDMRKLAKHQPLLPALMKSADGLSVTFDPGMVRDLFYHDCPEGTLEFALTRLCAQAIAPQATPVALGPSYASVPRSYVICEDDQAIPPELQDRMAARFEPQDVHRMQCSHSPFFADPKALAALLDRIAA